MPDFSRTTCCFRAALRNEAKRNKLQVMLDQPDKTDNRTGYLVFYRFSALFNFTQLLSVLYKT